MFPVCDRRSSSLVERSLTMSYAFTVETVEPGNDRSLESWTNCPVRLVPLIEFVIVPLTVGLSGV
jgi:hypothetical protein